MTTALPLSKGKVALVDASDYPRVAQHRWFAFARKGRWYAARTAKAGGVKRTVYLHRELLGAPAGLEVDHVNGDGLDNRRANIRLATHAQNAINYRRVSASKSSRYQGVCLNKATRRWRAVICVDGRQRHLGTFIDEIAAARAYDLAARAHHGAFAVTHFTQEAA